MTDYICKKCEYVITVPETVDDMTGIGSTLKFVDPSEFTLPEDFDGLTVKMGGLPEIDLKSLAGPGQSPKEAMFNASWAMGKTQYEAHFPNDRCYKCGTTVTIVKREHLQVFYEGTRKQRGWADDAEEAVK